MEILRDVSLADFTTFRIGGAAECFCTAESVADLNLAAEFCKRSGETAPMRMTLLGNGSNVLVSDRGVRGLTVRVRLKGIEAVVADCRPSVIAAYAGETLPALSSYFLAHGFSGLEWTCGIPASVGGAVIMNAGAYGFDIAKSVVWVEVLRDGTLLRLTADECGFSYRSSGFLPSDIIVCVGFKAYPDAYPDAYAAIRERMRICAQKRRAAQPHGRSAGSVFKAALLPGASAKTPAGLLIDRAGLKGTRVGGAAVSKQHANFILNTGNASAAEVLELIGLVKAEVKRRFGAELEEEIQYLGDF